ncbi:hypothetical protein JCM3770_001753 [Rhodotorula araucariae]
MHSISFALATLALSLVSAAPFPQGNSPLPASDTLKNGGGKVNGVDPTALSPETKSSSESTAASSDPSELSNLTGTLSSLQDHSGMAPDEGDHDPNSAPSSAFAMFDQDGIGAPAAGLDLSSRPGGLGSSAKAEDIGESTNGGGALPGSGLASLSGDGALLGGIPSFDSYGSGGAGSLGGSAPESDKGGAGDKAPTSKDAATVPVKVLAVDPTTELETATPTGIPDAAPLATDTTTATPADKTGQFPLALLRTTALSLEAPAYTVTPPAALLAANTTAAAHPVETVTTFDLDDFLSGASFPAEATTAIAGAA